MRAFTADVSQATRWRHKMDEIKGLVEGFPGLVLPVSAHDDVTVIVIFCFFFGFLNVEFRFLF